MIDKDVFATGMGLLCGAFNRTLDAAVSRAYYGTLGQRMTTAEFEAAVQKCLADDTFWPSPAVLLAKVQTDPMQGGAAALEHVNRVLSAHGGHRYLTHATYHAEFDGPTRAAISAVGGLAEITGTTIERHPGMVRKFATAYASALAGPKRLASPPIDPRVTSLVAGIVGRDRSAGASAND